MTVLITNFSFAMTAKEELVPAQAMEMVSIQHEHNMDHTSNNSIDCEVFCNAIMMTCASCISSVNVAPNLTAQYQPIILKIDIFTAHSLYSVDLIPDHKPPIFSKI